MPERKGRQIRSLYRENLRILAWSGCSLDTDPWWLQDQCCCHSTRKIANPIPTCNNNNTAPHKQWISAPKNHFHITNMCMFSANPKRAIGWQKHFLINWCRRCYSPGASIHISDPIISALMTLLHKYQTKMNMSQSNPKSKYGKSKHLFTCSE